MSDGKKAMFWSKDNDGGVRCGLCPHRCCISEMASGVCGVRVNRGSELFAAGYGVVSSIALDPIEKKPLYMFRPGKHVLSIGGYGCNLKCRFCQNYEISTVSVTERGDGKPKTENGEPLEAKEPRKMGQGQRLTPDDIVELALRTVPDGNIGVAYTYNEPLVGYEYLRDCARLVRGAGLGNVIVTNGYINEEPLGELLPLTDAMNIDLKGFTDGFYRRVGGDLQTVMKTITAAHKQCHVEVTTLVIPGENEADVEGIARWLASIDPGIPLHLSRFFPRYIYSDRAPTPRNTILKAKDLAKAHLKNVFTGNMW